MADEVIGGISASISVDDSGLDAGMAKLQSAIERTKGDISGLNDALRSGTLSAEDYATKLAKSEASLKSLERASASLQTQLSSQAAAQMSASQAAEAATAAQVAAQARAISSSGAWGAVSTASAANIARLRAEERAMTVLPVSGLQSSGLRVQDQLRAEDAAAAQRARRRQEYVDDVKKGEEARRRAESGMRGGGFGGGGGMLNLAVIGQTLDDMQYVGEMGLRPIINNLMQIHPLLGLAALGFDQMRKHGAEVVPVLESLSKNLLGLNLDVGGLMGDEDSRSLEQKISELGKTPSTLAKFWDDLKTNIQMIPGAVGEFTGTTDRARAAEIAAFEGGDKNPEQKKRGKEVVDAIGRYGNREFLAALVPGSGNEEVDAGEKQSLIGLVKRAGAGDRSAIAELESRTSGIPMLGDAIAASGDAAKGRAIERGKIAEDVAAQQYMDEFAMSGGLEGPGKKERDEIAKGQAEERAKMAAEVEAQSLMEEFEAGGGLEGMSPKDMDRHARLTERNSDLQWNLFRLMNPNQEVRQLAGDAYAASLHGSTGISEEAKRLHDIYEIEKQIAENTQNLKNVGQARRVRR